MARFLLDGIRLCQPEVRRVICFLLEDQWLSCPSISVKASYSSSVIPNQFSGCGKVFSLTSLTYWLSPSWMTLPGFAKHLGHARLELRVEPEAVVVDQKLAVRVRSGAQAHDDAVVRPLGDELADPVGHHLEQNAERAGFFEGFGVSMIFFACSAPLPWTLKPPSALTDCGVNPRWPIAGMPALTMPAIRSAISTPPSSLIASQPGFSHEAPRVADRALDRRLVAHVRHVADHEGGRARRAARPGCAGSCLPSSRAGSSSKPRIVIPRLSPTRIISIPAWSWKWAVG